MNFFLFPVQLMYAVRMKKFFNKGDIMKTLYYFKKFSIVVFK